MNTRLTVFLVMTALIMASLTDLFANVINVPDDFETIQAAVNNTQEGDTVLVQPGVYNERVGMPARNIVLASLRIIDGDEGFIERTIIDCININRSTIRIADGTDERTVIDGFTIINGDTDYGGGIYIANAGPTLRFLILSDNDADRGGGGLYVTRMSWPSISNSIIRNNFGFIGGGVVVINGSRLTVTDCIIEGNTTNEHGAGIHCTLDSELNMEEVIIRENVATMFGGGLHINARTVANLNRVRIVDNIGDTGGGIAVRAEAVLNATDVEVVGNFSSTNGGGLYADGSIINMTDCSFFNNSSQSQGGGQYFWAGTAEFTRCIIADNECPTAGVIQNLWGETSYYNCTIANNRGEESSEIGVIIGKLTLLNTIVWSEDRPILTTSPDDVDSIAVSYCDITGGLDAFELGEDDIFEWGEGNINGDPLFADIEELDFHITEDSPCIDGGDPRTERDPDNTLADIGVFYFHQDEDPLPHRHEVPFEFETIQAGIDAAENGDTVYVHWGEYEEFIDFTGKSILVTGDPENPAEVILNGNGNGTVVTFSNNEQNESILTGFTITGGTGTRLELNDFTPSGGGILIINASPVIRNCIIEGNILAEGGGRRGGGVAIWQNSEPLIRDCVIRDNEAGDGGGISVSLGGVVTLENVEILNNSARDGDDSDGGGIYVLGAGNEQAPRISLSDCRISGNEGVFGSGIYMIRCSARIDRCELSNHRGFYGSGMLAILCEVELTNVTVSGNEVDDRVNDWGVIDISGGVATIINSILYQPDELDLTSNYFDEGDQVANIAYSLINGGEDELRGDGFSEINWGEGNIDEDPLFVDAENGNYHLTLNSPCIDAGDPDSPEDPDGTRADMGAFPFDQRDNPAELEHFVDFVETDFQHSIIINNFTFDGEVAPEGWEIAVFTREYVLSGAVLWSADEDVVLIAYGDNPDTDEIEGFYDGEWMMNFKVWDQEEEREYRAGYDFDGEIELCHWNDGVETTLGLWSNSDIVEQVIELEEGVSNFAINLIPSGEFFSDPDDEFPSISQMTNQFWDRPANGGTQYWLLLLRDEDGRFFNPRMGFDNLRWIIPGVDHQISMEGAMTGTWWGMPLNDGDPELQHFVDVTVTEFTFELTIPEFTFDGEEVAPGWEIGVFTRDDVLAGAGVWTGEELVVTVYGDNPETEEIEGFYQGEWMGNVRGWDPETEEVHRVGNEGNYWNNELAAQMNLWITPGTVEQQVRLNEGWNMVSLNICPAREFFENEDDEFPCPVPMTYQLWDYPEDDDWHHHHILLKDDRGLFYVPEWAFHNFHQWRPDRGCQILMDTDMTAIWWGTQIAPDEEIVLVEGWGIYPYYPNYELSADAQEYYVLSNIIENVEIAKDELGHFMVPGFDFSNMPPWRAGEGYQIKTTQECVLVYPEERDEELNAAENTLIRHWDQPTPTGNNMSILVELKDVVAQNSEIAAFTESGQLVGCGVVNENGQCGLAVWGDDESTEEVDGLLAGEALMLKLWDGMTQGEIDLQVSELLKGEGLIYASNGFTALACSEVIPLPTEMKILSIAPNPFNPTTTIIYALPEPSAVSLKIYDLSGRIVTDVFNGRQEAGIHSALVRADTWASGLYFARLEAGGEVFTRKVMLVR